MYVAELATEVRLPASQMIAESPSLANLQNKQNRESHYQAVRCQQPPGVASSNRNSNSNESGSYKAEGNGEPTFSTQL